MWFKQVQVFQLTQSLHFNAEQFMTRLEPLLFQPAAPSMASSMGWVPSVDEDGAPLVRMLNGHVMLCLQIEEKVLPATVIRYELEQKIKEIQVAENRKVRPKEKLDLRDDIILTLLPRAFSKFTKIYGYIDTKNQWLVLGTTNPKKTENFLSMLKKSITEYIKPFELKRLAPIITYWLQNKNYPTNFSIEKSCVMQDATQKTRVIRAQQQDLFAGGIQALLKDGCEIRQLALCWQDHLEFNLLDDFTIRSLKFQDEVKEQAQELEAETKQQQFDADFLIMSEALSGLLKELLEQFVAEEEVEADSKYLEKAVAS